MFSSRALSAKRPHQSLKFANQNKKIEQEKNDDGNFYHKV